VAGAGLLVTAVAGNGWFVYGPQRTSAPNRVRGACGYHNRDTDYIKVFHEPSLASIE